MIVKRYMASAGLSNESAQRIGSFIDRKFEEGRVTPADLVAAATPKRSPIHDDFEWDDAVAAHQHRLRTAGTYLRHIKVVYVREGGDSGPTRAFHHVVVDRQDDAVSTAYVAARVVWETPDYAAQVVEQARLELEAWTSRYREYESLASHVAAIDGLIERFPAAA